MFTLSELLRFFILLVFSIMTQYFYSQFVSIYLNKEIRYKTQVIFSVLSGLTGNIIVFAMDFTVKETSTNSILKTLLVFIAVIIFTMGYLKINLKNSFITQLFFVIFEGVCSVLISLAFLAMNVDTVNIDLYSYAIANTLLVLFNYTAIDVLTRLKLRKHLNLLTLQSISKSQMINVILIFCALALIMTFSNTALRSPNTQRSYALVVMISAVIFTAYMMSTLQNSVKHLVTKEELKNQVFYNNALDTLLEDLRRFKHDYANILNCIGGYAANNDMEGLKKFFKEVINTFSSTPSSSIQNLENIKNAGIFGLLIAKVEYAKKFGVQITFSIDEEINQINMKVLDLCEVLGILLDNAIEAAACAAEKMVELHISLNNGGLIISVANNYIVEDTNRIAKVCTGNGMGLSIVRRIVSNYSNVSYVSATSRDNSINKYLAKVVIE